MKNNYSIWKNCKVLITGHTGFKGGWLSLWLKHMGANITGISLTPETERGIYTLARLEEEINSYIQDIQDPEAINRIFTETKPEVVFHMAAQPLVRLSYKNPILTYATNIMGTVNLMEAIRNTSSVKAVIIVTSDKCYENQEWVWGYRENDKLGGYDPYSNSKACVELVVSAYRNSYFKPFSSFGHSAGISTVRAGNVIGGGDWSLDRLIPDFFRSVETANPIQIRSPNAIRPWQHVLEPLSGYMLLAEHMLSDAELYSSTWNFGPDDRDAKTVKWIVDYLANKWGESVDWIIDNKLNPHETNYLKLDTSKVKSRLGWRPSWDLKESLNKIIDWHQALYQGEDMREISLHQIESYTKS